MENRIQKLIRLANSTGDRLIVFDQDNPDEAFVLMNTDEYEKIINPKKTINNLTEEELLDKINREIATWKDAQSNNIANDVDTELQLAKNHEDELTKRVNELSNEYIDTQDIKKTSNKWNIPGERKKAADEVIEEDRQYIISDEDLNY